MSSPQLATLAPESDAMEDQPLHPPTEPTPPSHPPTLSSHCTTDRPLPADSLPSGELTTYDSIATYISKPADYPSTPGRLLLLLTNGRGILSPNNQLQADSFAAQGFVVVMPDLFAGDPAPDTTTTTTTVDPEASWLDTIKSHVVATSKSFIIDMWLARHTAEKVMPILTTVLDRAREEFADSVSNGGGVYAVGYCFGGKYVLTLAAGQGLGLERGVQQQGNERAVEDGMVTGPLIKCGAVAHGTLVTREDFRGVVAPISLVCVENDPLFPDEVLEYGKKELATSRVEHEVRVYAGVPHGFAVIGEYDSVSIKEAQTAASAQLLSWLQTH